MEQFKNIEGYEGLYQISNYGNVKALQRIRHYGGGRYGTQKEIILKPGNNNHLKYKFVYLRKEGKNRKFYVHRLVGQAFLGLDINNKKQHVCHKDDNPENNKNDNLFIGTHRDNMKDMIKKGRDRKRGLKGESNIQSKLTEIEVLNIREQLQKGVSGYSLSKIYNVSRVLIYSIRDRKTWKHI